MIKRRGIPEASLSFLDVISCGFGAIVLLFMFLWLWRDFAQAYRSDEFTGAPGAYMIQLWPFKLGIVVGCGTRSSPIT